MQLPVFAILFFSLKTAFRNFGYLIFTSLGLVALLAALSVLTRIAPSDQSSALPLSAMGVAAYLMYIYLLACFSINWHRRILLGETATFQEILFPRASPWRYLLMALYVILLVALTLVIPFIAMLLFSKIPVVQAILSVIFVPIAAIAWVRLGMALPSAAIEGHALSPFKVMSYSQGNNWRFLGLALLVVVVNYCAGYVLSLLIQALFYGLILGQNLDLVSPQIFGNLSILMIAQIGVKDWVSLVVSTAVISSLYAYFVGGWQFSDGELKPA